MAAAIKHMMPSLSIQKAEKSKRKKRRRMMSSMDTIEIADIELDPFDDAN